MRVYLTTRTVGQCFATVGQIRRVGSRKLVAEPDTIRPYGFTGAAYSDAESLAAQLGLTVVEV